VSTTAIVVNFNAGEHLDRCVADLLHGEEKPRVWVVDNASTDGSAERLRNRFGQHPSLEVTFNPTNLGFARAVNACARALKDEFLLVVNPDCRLPPATLVRLREALDEDPEAGLAAPLVRGASGRAEPATLRRFPRPWNSLMTMTGLWRMQRSLPSLHGICVPESEYPPKPAPAEAVSGACMLVRRVALVEVGYLDEGYGLHCEDLDLMFRLQESGWRCLFVPGAEVTHAQGVSSRSRPVWVHRQKHLGMRRFFDKHLAAEYSPFVRWLVRTAIRLRCMALLPLATRKR